MKFRSKNCSLGAALFLAGNNFLFANPTGMTVVSGSAIPQQNGSQLNVIISQAAFLNWSSFDIQPGETTTFVQPSASSVAINLIGGANPSQIFGNLNANGTVILANASGFYFGPNSMIKVGGSFIATTAPLTPDFGAGSAWQFTGMPPLKSIVNYGQIQVGNGKSLFLIAEQIENHGELAAPGGDVGLYAGESVLVSDRPDGRGLSATVQIPSGSINNFGQITADAGTIALQAQVVNQDGIIQADSVQNQNGVIELVASDSLKLGADSRILARGDDAASGSSGGSVTLKSDNTFSDTGGSKIVTTGGANGGNGGSVEISARDVQSLNSSLNARAQAGWTAGKLLLDPDYIILDLSGSGSAGSGAVLAGDNPGSTLDLNVNSAFANLAVSQIILQAAYDITLAGGTSWNLSGTIGANYGGVTSGQLTLEAGRNIIFGAGSKITDANDWSVTLAAGYNFANNTVRSGVGNIYLNGGSGSIQLSQGIINLTAGNSIVVGSGSQIIDDGGTIGLYASTVDQDGLIQANSVGNQHGTIELVASDTVALGKDSQIIANGDNSPDGSAGGQIMVQTAQTFSDVSDSQIEARGGANGGAGGRILIYAALTSVNSQLDVSAQAGSAGNLFYYPRVDSLTLTANSLAPFAGFSHILFQANEDITIAAGETLNLSATTGSQTSGQLTLEAGDSSKTDGNIIFGAGSKITDANDWSVTLEAGYNFANQAVQSGIGNIYLNCGSGLSQSSTIQLFAGSINLWAGQSILLAAQNNHAKSIVSGSVFTTGGGGIFAYALAGDIDAGTSNGGTSSTTQTSDYNFTDSGSTPNPVLGGISTAGGGNVTLIAGNNIDSTPVVQSGQWPGASGAYGAGNVTVIAGNQINGNYMLANGVGTMLAGVQVQSGQAGVLQNPNANPTAYASKLKELETAVTQTQNLKGNIGGIEYAGQSPSSVTLSLIEGSWNAWAANNIYLKEVNNPNGTFNSAQSYLYNYAPDAAANLWAGNAIELAGGMVGGTLARVPRGNQNIIYAPSLSLNAGAGGIQIDKSIILAPSSEGSLELITRDGGNLSGWVTAGSTVLIGITMSDSDSTDYKKFATGHAATPLHLNDPNPVTLDVSGSIESFGLTVPTFAQINIVGDTYNFGFLGQNLLPSQTTSIDVGQTAKANMEHLGLLDPNTDGSLTVGGDITYRGDLTSIPSTGQLAEPLPAFLFDLALSGDSEVASKLRYDAITGKLTFIGVMSSAELAFLLNPTKVVLDANGQPVLNPVLDANGNPVLDSNGNPETVPATQPVTLDSTQKTEIQQLSAASQSATLGDQGLAIAGPGNFNITAHSLDLGISGGVSVVAPDSALAAISPYGANLNVTTGGNLELTSTKIANESLLGGINLDIGGTLDVGGQFTTFGDPSSPKGIFTTSGGNVSITANGDVNVDGSRIAAYNGGNINIKSLVGDVNAGAGGEGYVTLNALEIDPATGQLAGIPATIPGSGILATAVFGSDALLGNITVNAPNGSINASLGGIIQIAFNDADTRNNFIELTAGHDINASGSGIIGSNIKLQAGGDINGLVIGSQSVNINSAQSVDVTVVSGGDVNINASGEIAGTVIGGGSVNASGDSITASLISESVSASGDTSGATEGVPQSNVAKNNAETADNASTVASKTDDLDDDETRKNGKDIALVQKTSRVTVILPAKQQSKAQNLEPGT